MAVSAGERLRRALGRPGYPRVELPGDPSYETGRLPWQRAVEHRPAAVVHATGTAEVAAAVRAAADAGLAVTAMTTGHGSVAGVDGAVLLNLSGFRNVDVDPKLGHVSVGAGTLWSDVLHATKGTSLVPLCGTVATIGVTGYSLQGGLGWLARSDGFAAAGIVEAEMVAATGKIVVASPEEHPELWWALRGGGGSFGVVTNLKLRLATAGAVLGGYAYFPVEKAERLLRSFADWSETQPEWSNAAVMLLQVPDRPQLPALLRGRRVVAVRAFAAAGEAIARQVMNELIAPGGPPLAVDYTYGSFNDMITEQGPPPPPVASHERIDLFDRLDDAVIEAMLATAGPGSDDVVACVELRMWGGALARDNPARAGAHPSTRYSIITGARYEPQWEAGRVDEAVGAFVASLKPYSNGETLLNLCPDPGATAGAFTSAAYDRLRSVKAAWDPDDIFQPGHRIPPATSIGATF